MRSDQSGFSTRAALWTVVTMMALLAGAAAVVAAHSAVTDTEHPANDAPAGTER